MRFTVSAEQHKFFHTQGYLELEDLISEEEAKSLIKAINRIKEKSPGYPEENLHRSLDEVATLAKKRGWGQIAADLLHKRPLRLKFDKFFYSNPVLTEQIEDDSCGILVDLLNKKAVFFKKLPIPDTLYNSPKSCYFLLIMTAKFLPEKLNPLIVT